jgi:LuxR family transcriptional regulator, activator of conjugal transfer of Ti plasmids
MSLSPREVECLKWVAEGKTSWDTGIILNISRDTVNFHIKNAMRKLRVNKRNLAVMKAIRLGFLENTMGSDIAEQ